MLVEGADEVAHGDVGEVAAFPVAPFLVLFLQDGADQAGHGVAVGEDLHDVGAALDLSVEAFNRVVRPDLLPMLARQWRERGEVGLGSLEHGCDLGERGAEAVGDGFVLGEHGFGGGLREDRRDQRVDGLGTGRSDLLGDVAGEMNPATLPPRSGQDRLDRGFQAGVRIRGDQGHAERVGVGGDLQPAVAQAAEELRPEIGGLRVTQRHPEDLPASLTGDAGRDDEGLGDDTAAVADIEVGGVQEQVREPSVIDPAREELLHGFVDLTADPRHRRPGDAGVVAQRPDQLIDLAGGHPVDPGLTDHRVERLVDPTTRVQQRREERPLPQLRNLQVDLPGRSGEGLRAGAVTPGRAFRGALMRARADLHGRFRVDQILQPGLQHPAEHIGMGEVGIVEDFADQGRQGRLVVGHRGISALLLAGNNWSPHGGPSVVYNDENPAGSDTTLWDSPDRAVGLGATVRRATDITLRSARDNLRERLLHRLSLRH
ncbi:hypothetical protein MIC448_820029 [Microbacterium sp. C448]|nr:hypothetical protein MIC448_820029 [Microbacterium sp. C448]